jgi:DNA helicase II / ATP-dependent DNA helicase PcrA
MANKQELSAEIVDFDEGALLVEASAGSGKTRILTERVRRLLTEKKDKYFSVLCLTFTNKAADEMKARLEDIPKLSERTFIGNFHGFCLNQIIRKQRHEIGLHEIPHIFSDNDRKNILKDIFLQNDELKPVYEFSNIVDKKQKDKAQQDLIDKQINFISDAKRQLIVVPENVTIWQDWNEIDTFIYKNYNDTLINQNAMDYDDILLYAYRILSERPAVANIYRRLYRYILVDEAQDLNFAQYNLLKAICGETHKNLMMVGDPKQAIYAFNGASAAYMQEEFVNDFGATQRSALHNYRSSTKVLELAHHIRSNGGMPNNYFTGIREIILFEDEKTEATWIISEIKKWINMGFYQEKDVKIPITLEDIAVLARSRYVFKELIHKLNEDETLKNNFFLRKSAERFEPESQLVKVFDLGIRILINPLDILHFNQLYQELGLPETTIKNRLESLLSLNQIEKLSFEKKTWLSILVELWKKINIKPKFMDSALNELNEKVSELDFNIEEKLKVDYDIKEFQKLWKGFLKNTPSESQNLANFRYFLALNSIDAHKEGLTLATIHTVKGLEYDIVFLMGMNEGVLPDFRAKEEKEKINEERNNTYVAVTRAKKCIYVTYPRMKATRWGDKLQTISRFISDFPNDKPTLERQQASNH